MQNKVCITVGCPSIKKTAAAAGLLLSAVWAGDDDRPWQVPSSISAAAPLRSPALSSKCGQCHVDSRVDEAEH